MQAQTALAALLGLAIALSGCSDPDPSPAGPVPNLVVFEPVPPPGLDEPVRVEFAGHLDVTYYCLPVGVPVSQVGALVAPFAWADHPLEVPVGTRWLNATLEWDTPVPDPTYEDIELEVYDADGTWRAGSYGEQPERVEIELATGDEGLWTVSVYICQSPPVDYVATVEMA